MSTVQNSLTRQQFSMITSSVRIAVLDHHCLLYPFSGCLSVIDCQCCADSKTLHLPLMRLHEFLRIFFTNFKNFVKFANFYEF